mmetsp:Transcript_25294/g.39180  ORF Transcript_25294/g.39180 Transcript_25294/m.39180 type:complete len:312 (-) Transcript_25294:526-1461(-)
MKVSSSILSLFLAQQASAYVSPQQSVSRKTVLYSSWGNDGAATVSPYSTFRANTGPNSSDANIAGTRTAFTYDNMVVSESAREAWFATWDALEPAVRVQGGALKTWSYSDPEIERVYVAMTTEGPPEGNPLKVDVELNQGPDNTPQKMKIYSGKGRLRPFKMWIETPGPSSAVFVRNENPVEFPCVCGVGAETASAGDAGLIPLSNAIYEMSPEQLVQGAGGVRSYDLDPAVKSVRIVMKTDGRPLNAKVELVQGPNAPKYTIDVYSEDGDLRPFVCVFETPGAGNVVRVLNSAPLEFPCLASVGPSIDVP